MMKRFIGLILTTIVTMLAVVALATTAQASPNDAATRTPRPTRTPTLTRTATLTRTPTNTRTITPTRTETRTKAPTRTPLPTRTKPPTRTPIPSKTPTEVGGHTFNGKVVDPPWWPCERGQTKGNRNSMIYHWPTARDYARTYENVACFNTTDEAAAAGFHAAKR